MRNALLLFALLTASFSQAQLVAWNVRVGGGTNDVAKFAVSRDGKVLIALETDGLMALARVDQASGHTDWIRKLGKGTVSGFDWSTNFQNMPAYPALVYGNYVDPAGYSHARIYAIDPATGGVKWFKGGMGGPDTLASKVIGCSLTTGFRVMEAGSEEGRAVVTLRSLVDGSFVKSRDLPGSSVTFLNRNRFATDENGRAWVGALTPLGDIEHELELTYAPDPNAKFENVSFFTDSLDNYFVLSDLVQELGGRHALLQATDAHGFSIVTNRLMDGAAQTSWIPAASPQGPCPTLLRTVDLHGKARTVFSDWVLDSHNPWPYFSYTLPFNVHSYGLIGEAFLVGTGWDLVTMSSWNASIKAIPFDLGGDESFVVAVQDTKNQYNSLDQFWVANSVRQGATQIRFAKLQGVDVRPAPTSGDNVPGKAVLLGSSAPTGGYDLTITAPTDAPVQLSSHVHINAGETFGRMTVIPKPLTKGTVVELTLTAQGRRWNTTLSLRPVSGATLQCGTQNLTAGTSAYFTVTINNLAPEGGQPVTLSRTDAALDMPTQVVVPAGHNMVRFLGTARPVTEDKDVTVSAWFNGKASQVHITVKKSG